MVKVGLTGSIGTGKSTVKNIFKELGAYVIDADQIVHNLWESKQIQKKAEEILGEHIFNQDGSINKQKIAQIIFNQKKKKKQLENLFHPAVFQYIQHWFKDIYKKDKKAVAIVEVPLMIETGTYKNYDKIIVVYAPKQTQIDRLMKKGYTYQEAIQRINSQMDIEEKVKYGDFVIDNSRDMYYLRKQVKNIYEKLKELA